MEKRTVRLTESDLNEMVLHRVRSIVGEDPVFPADRFRRFKSKKDRVLESALLDEGLIRTYPFDWVCKYLQRNANSDFKEIVSNEDERRLMVTVKRESKSIAPLKRIMNTFGYYCGYEYDDKEDDSLIIQFEQKFEEYVKGSELCVCESAPFLFHVAPQKYRDKILRQGLVPRHRNKMFQYPGRVYFISFYDGWEAAYEMAMMLYGANGYKEGEEKYDLFGIYVKGIEDTKFYRDWNVGHAEAYYTYENIPPASISYLKTFKLNSYATV